jgi:hypothetical protein
MYNYFIEVINIKLSFMRALRRAKVFFMDKLYGSVFFKQLRYKKVYFPSPVYGKAPSRTCCGSARRAEEGVARMEP